jgi:hypothetical protein
MRKIGKSTAEVQEEPETKPTKNIRERCIWTFPDCVGAAVATFVSTIDERDSEESRVTGIPVPLIQTRVRE